MILAAQQTTRANYSSARAGQSAARGAQLELPLESVAPNSQEDLQLIPPPNQSPKKDPLAVLDGAIYGILAGSAITLLVAAAAARTGIGSAIAPAVGLVVIPTAIGVGTIIGEGISASFSGFGKHFYEART